MLAFYTDPQLKRRVTSLTPKKFLLPCEGGSRTTTLYLGDPDLPSGKVYVSAGNILIGISGGATADLMVSLKRADQTVFGFVGTPAMYANNVLSSPIAVDVQINVVAGAAAVMSQLELIAGAFVLRDQLDLAPVRSTEQAFTITCPFQVQRRNQGLPQHARLLPLNREVKANLPGFIVGEHRWRDKDTSNAVALVPSKWTIDPEAIGAEKFVSGIGHGSDLEPVSVEESEDSVFLRVKHGNYFVGPERHFLPADPELEVLSSSQTALVLEKTPRAQTPVFVGTWRLNAFGYYVKDTVYRYVGPTFRPDEHDKQFTLSRKERALELSEPMQARNLLLGVVNGESRQRFDVPIYPVANVRAVYVNRGPNLPPTYANAFEFDKSEGTITVSALSAELKGYAVYAECDPAVAALYEPAGSKDTTRLLPADLNPAFSGISHGFVYLQHCRQKAASVTLSVDKPRIAVPPIADLPVGLVAFGPVFYESDYALLSAAAYDSSGQPLSNVVLKVIPAAGFSGLVNYKDPAVEDVTVRTGGDGQVNLIYTPVEGFGNFIQKTGLGTTHVSNDTLILPSPIDFSRLYSAAEGWLVTTCSVANDNPLYGKVGADPNKGEIAFAESFNPYRCNGLKRPLLNGSSPVYPMEAYDSTGKKHTDAGFNGAVVKLVYSAALPSAANIAACFIAFVDRVTMLLQAVESGAKSNSIMLQMAPPELQVADDPWITLDDAVNGKLDSFRLGWSHQFDTPNLALVGNK
jgi:hypothetical protein